MYQTMLGIWNFMRFIRSIGLILTFLLCVPFAWTQDQDGGAESEAVDSGAADTRSSDDFEATDFYADDVIIVCPITGAIEPGVQVLVDRAIQEARDLNAKLIILRVDTPGGRVDSAVEIAKAIGEAPCRTLAYIEGMGAISAGALISFACDDLIMTADTNIGAATPVFATSSGMETASEKSISFMRAKMRALAEAKGHNADIAQAMVDKDIELRGYEDEMGNYVVYATNAGLSVSDSPDSSDALDPIQEIIDSVTEDLPFNFTVKPKDEPDSAEEPAEEPDIVTVGDARYVEGSELVLAKGKLLTLTPKEAIRYGVIDRTVDSYDEAVTHYMMGGGTYHIIEPNWAEKTFRFLTSPTIAGLLLMLGMGGLYLEVRTPGFGFPGIIGVVCLCLFFGSHYVLGMADTIDILLVIAGVILILVEIFVIPGFGIAGVSGTIMLLLGLYLSLVNFTVPEYSWDFDRLNDVAYSFAVFVVSATAFIIATWKLMPMMPFYGAMVLSDTMVISDGYIGQDLDEAAELIGQRGRSTSPLRPTGKGEFAGKRYDIVSRGDFIERDVAIRIVETSGNRYVVVPDKEA